MTGFCTAVVSLPFYQRALVEGLAIQQTKFWHPARGPISEYALRMEMARRMGGGCIYWNSRPRGRWERYARYRRGRAPIYKWRKA